MKESIEDVNKRIRALKENISKFEAAPEVVKTDDDDEEVQDYENKLTDEVLGRFVDGLLITLGELELEGAVPPIDSPTQAQKAILGIIRRLYTRKGVVSKMGRKFVRVGAKQFLRKQRNALTRSMK